MSQSARLVQSGEGDRRFVVLLYLIHPDRDPALREALGLKPMILARADDGDPGPTVLAELLAAGANRIDVAGIVLGGWSAGCSGVRARLLEGGPQGLRALVLADGTHASLPPQAWQLDVWRPWIERARTGEICAVCGGEGQIRGTEKCHGMYPMLDCVGCAGSGRRYPFVFAASHTYQTYVEHLPSGKAYTSTVNVLRELTGWNLEAGKRYPNQPTTAADGGLSVESWASAAIDGPAHVRQQTEALPGMLARYVRPMIEASIL